jgi:hypothetical protein
MLIYLNRGLFVSAAYEVDNRENGELNTVIEFLIQLATGEENGIDEDEDMQSNSICVNIIQHDCSQNFELTNLLANNAKKLVFPNKEDIPSSNFNDRIDHPPEMMA